MRRAVESFFWPSERFFTEALRGSVFAISDVAIAGIGTGIVIFAIFFSAIELSEKVAVPGSINMQSIKIIIQIKIAFSLIVFFSRDGV
jgi:hypothetical protein